MKILLQIGEDIEEFDFIMTVGVNRDKESNKVIIAGESCPAEIMALQERLNNDIRKMLTQYGVDMDELIEKKKEIDKMLASDEMTLGKLITEFLKKMRGGVRNGN